MKFKTVFLVLFYCFFTVKMTSQTGYIHGKILDSITQKPIPFATIIFEQNKLGLYASEEGDFTIETKPYFESDTLLISSIGYNQKQLLFSELIDAAPNIIYLSQATIELKEIELDPITKKEIRKERRANNKAEKISSKKLIKYAIENIKNNYSTQTFDYVSYYRDYQKSGKKYINLNEGLIHTVDDGFKSDVTTGYNSLLDYRENQTFERREMTYLYDSINIPNQANPNKTIPLALLSNQGGNEFFILRVHDPIRNYKSNSFSFIHVFEKDFIKNHNFSKVEKVYNNDLLLYKIAFKSKPKIGSGYASAFGTIFIQPNDYTIHKIDYTGVDEHTKKEIFNVRLEYGYSNAEDTLMELKYISFNNLFRIVDETDTNYFKINYATLQDSHLKIDFNNYVDPKSVDKKYFYRIYEENGKNIKINSIEVKDNVVFVHFDTEKIASIENLKFDIQGNGFKDVDGKYLNRKRILEFYQYRELFVQEFNPNLRLGDECILENLPLKDHCILQNYSAQKYWMNSPKGINKAE